MYAIVTVAGQQTRVEMGQIVKVPLLPDEPGTKTTFDQVCLVCDGDNIKVGRPTVENAEVSAEVVEHGRDKKITHVKKIRRKHHKRFRGHRQAYTELKILDIKTGA